MILELNNPVPYLLELVSHPTFFPVNATVDKANPNWAEHQSSFVGNGPFQLKEWKHNDLILASKNENYWDKKAVKLAELTMVMVEAETGFKMFENKELEWDGSPLSSIPIDAISELKEKKALEVQPTLGTRWIRINTEKAPFNSQKMRKAFGFAINRQELIDHVIQGNQIAATGIVPTSMGLQEKPLFKDGDTATAKELFQEALKEQNLSSNKLPTITMLYVASEENHRLAQALQSQWFEAFNVHVNLESTERKLFFDRCSKSNYILAISDWQADFNDPINFLEVFKTKAVGTNNTNWENTSYSQLLTTSYACTDKKERLNTLRTSEELIINEMPIVPLYHYAMTSIKDSKLKGVVLNSMGNIDFKHAYLDKSE